MLVTLLQPYGKVGHNSCSMNLNSNQGKAACMVSIQKNNYKINLFHESNGDKQEVYSQRNHIYASVRGAPEAYGNHLVSKL